MWPEQVHKVPRHRISDSYVGWRGWTRGRHTQMRTCVGAGEHGPFLGSAFREQRACHARHDGRVVQRPGRVNVCNCLGDSGTDPILFCPGQDVRGQRTLQGRYTSSGYESQSSPTKQVFCSALYMFWRFHFLKSPTNSDQGGPI